MSVWYKWEDMTKEQVMSVVLVKIRKCSHFYFEANWLCFPLFTWLFVCVYSQSKHSRNTFCSWKHGVEWWLPEAWGCGKGFKVLFI